MLAFGLSVVAYKVSTIMCMCPYVGSNSGGWRNPSLEFDFGKTLDRRNGNFYGHDMGEMPMYVCMHVITDFNMIMMMIV